jgi:hypothetical protein
MRSLAALLASLAITLDAGSVSSSHDDRLQTPIDVQEWSIWVGTPTQPLLNASRIYPNAMPGPVGTSRPKMDAQDEERCFAIGPLSVVQFFGEPTSNIDVEIRVKRGNLLAHWPGAKERGSRLRWFGSDLLADRPAGLPLPYLPESHEVTRLRNLDPALYLRNENTVERFLAYDAEVPLAIPMRLRGGPEEYTLQNLTAHPLRDVALIAPTPTGFRVGWLDELPSAVVETVDKEEVADTTGDTPKRSDAEKAAELFDRADRPTDDKKEEPTPLPNEGDATVQARMDQVLNRAVTLDVEKLPLRDVLDRVATQARFRYEMDDRTLAKEEIDPNRPATLRAGGLSARDALAELLGSAGLSYRVTDRGILFITTAARLAEAMNEEDKTIEGPPITLTLSQPLEPSNPSYRELTRDAYARRLAGQGLRREVVEALLDRYASALFEPDELIVIAHIDREAIDDVVLLDVFPPPKSQVRVAALVIHGIDPRLQDQARTLVEQLGDTSPKIRDSAEARLFELGSVAVPALEDALTSKDVEVVFRAERLLLRLNRPVP